MKLRLPKLLLLIFSAFLFSSGTQLSAQYLFNNDSAFAAGTPKSGKLSALTFGDYYYKAHSDSLNRGGKAQYSGIPQGRSAFQFRRIYLGYDYNITKKFSAELVLAMEDNFPAGNPPTSTAASGDLLSDGKISPYIKYANLRWKDIWKGTDLVVGQHATPVSAYSERLWGYRSLERVMTDITGSTPTYDMGASLQGVFDPSTKNYGYFLMVANGNKAVPENDNFKWFYTEIWAKFFEKHLQVYLFNDYERLNWTPTWHHDRSMIKGLVNYTSHPVTIGLEAYINHLNKDNIDTKKAGGADTLSVKANGISIFVKGPIIKDKLGFVVRYDNFNPDENINATVYNKFSSTTTGYNDPTTKQAFFLAALDWTPAPNVHFMPNIWYMHYATQLPGLIGKVNGDYDLAFRLTFQYAIGRN
jgi:hypothetical protein